MVERDVHADLEAEALRVLRSPAWAAAAGDEDRARLLVAAACDVLDRPHSASALAGAYRRVLRNRDIRAAFNGRNYAEIARRFHLTQRQLRRILHERTHRK